MLKSFGKSHELVLSTAHTINAVKVVPNVLLMSIVAKKKFRIGWVMLEQKVLDQFVLYILDINKNVLHEQDNMVVFPTIDVLDKLQLIRDQQELIAGKHKYDDLFY